MRACMCPIVSALIIYCPHSKRKLSSFLVTRWIFQQHPKKKAYAKKTSSKIVKHTDTLGHGVHILQRLKNKDTITLIKY